MKTFFINCTILLIILLLSGLLLGLPPNTLKIRIPHIKTYLNDIYELDDAIAQELGMDKTVIKTFAESDTREIEWLGNTLEESPFFSFWTVYIIIQELMLDVRNADLISKLVECIGYITHIHPSPTPEGALETLQYELATNKQKERELEKLKIWALNYLQRAFYAVKEKISVINRVPGALQLKAKELLATKPFYNTWMYTTANYAAQCAEQKGNIDKLTTAELFYLEYVRDMFRYSEASREYAVYVLGRSCMSCTKDCDYGLIMDNLLWGNLAEIYEIEEEVLHKLDPAHDDHKIATREQKQAALKGVLNKVRINLKIVHKSLPPNW